MAMIDMAHENKYADKTELIKVAQESLRIFEKSNPNEHQETPKNSSRTESEGG
jgi:hypothetical protein